jgi:TRAP-type C4-dicarboxylate transport system permease small subunit
MLVISDPILRYLAGRPIYWSNEVSTFMMVLMALASFGIALIKGKHVRVTLIFGKLSRQVQNVLWVITSLIGVFYTGILSYAVMRLALSSLIFGAVTPTAELPFFPWQMAGTFGLIVLFVAVVLFTVRRIGIASAPKKEKEEAGVIEGYGI